ncbi:zinc ribbon domain-containing protein [Azorhizophilus paspali]|uniref:zinc ribbon domain-containing protein n=1 Tax=Azorhizophilus paspali TaxID=69963 RepID=UPI00363C80A3
MARIDQWFISSKTCHACGYKAESMPLRVRLWQCADCGIYHDRDVNAALNIKRQGILKLKSEGLSVSAHQGLRKFGVSRQPEKMGSLALSGEEQS